VKKTKALEKHYQWCSRIAAKHNADGINADKDLYTYYTRQVNQVYKYVGWRKNNVY